MSTLDSAVAPCADRKRRLSQSDPFVDNANTTLSCINPRPPLLSTENPPAANDASVSAKKLKALASLQFLRTANLARSRQPRLATNSSGNTVNSPDASVSSSHADDEVLLEVLEEMHRLEQCFPTLASGYRLIDKIGEGTFSTVYKAEALNDSVKHGSDMWKLPPLKLQRKSILQRRKRPIVALKQIYVTSSPNRIYNELSLLYTLSGSMHVAPLLDVLRHQDQVVAVLPYYHHADFREFYRDLPVKGIKKYLFELFRALAFVHSKDVIHRDLKPTNFLYDPFKGKGVLVDFGLAERHLPTNNHACPSKNQCPCLDVNRPQTDKALLKRLNIKAAYPKQDPRPPRRANRAGTRGFRAPEVLLKCTHQSPKLDVWSAAVIALSFLARKFPLFNLPDDTCALVEIGLVFGIDRLRRCAELHGCGLELSLDSIYPHNGNLLRIVAELLRYEQAHDCFPPQSVVLDTLSVFSESGDALARPVPDDRGQDNFAQRFDNYLDHKHLFDLLQKCFHMDPVKRVSAKHALEHDFFREFSNRNDDEVLL